MLAAERQQDTVLRAGAKQSEKLPLRLGFEVGHRSLNSHHRNLYGVLLKNSLGTMPRGRMRNFMPENSGKTRLVLRNRQNARVDHNFSPGEAKGVLCRVLNYCNLPLVLLGTSIDNPDQSGSYPPDNVVSGAGLHDAGVTDNLAKALKSQLLLLRLR